MSVSPQVLTPRALLLYSAILVSGSRWLTRRDIAAQLRRGSLTARDHILLDLLVQYNLIEAELRTNANNSAQWFYRRVERC